MLEASLGHCLVGEIALVEGAHVSWPKSLTKVFIASEKLDICTMKVERFPSVGTRQQQNLYIRDRKRAAIV